MICAKQPDCVLLAGDIYDKPVPPAEAVVYVYISSDEYAGFVQRQDVYGAMWHWYISDQYCQQCT